MASDLPNDCGLVAAAAWGWLNFRGVPCRILRIMYGKHDGHTIVVFQSASRFCTYDADGSMVFTPDVNWETKPIKLARAWCKSTGVKKTPARAEWH